MWRQQRHRPTREQLLRLLGVRRCKSSKSSSAAGPLWEESATYRVGASTSSVRGGGRAASGKAKKGRGGGRGGGGGGGGGGGHGGGHAQRHAAVHGGQLFV